MSDKIMLLDGHSLLNRAFYGLPDLTNAEGKHTNAVLGFLNIMLRYVEEEKPTHLLVAFDRKEPTFQKANAGRTAGTGSVNEGSLKNDGNPNYHTGGN